MKDKREYKKETLILEAAIKDHVDGSKDIMEVAELHQISHETLTEEIRQYYHLRKHYQYDRKVMRNRRGFTYQQEELLLDCLRTWARERNVQPGICIICAILCLQQLSVLAYALVQKIGIRYLYVCASFKPRVIDTN